ncbi:hypothetical protein TSMG0030 [Halocynthia phage JM-2012]|uniref:hypothetical protein n=1 Tax=Halocynthia phage JM-2012 TaxID=1173297 RepID=UPI00025C68ED|nr:hypothetical protein TSMG0030 [Halocynthia phage JM-2012]AFI55313.1 hypothetical protein TSMG0030 [Halocynthia phage JM-2012]
MAKISNTVNKCGRLDIIHNTDSSVMMRCSNADYSIQIEEGTITLVIWGASYIKEDKLTLSNLVSFFVEYGLTIESHQKADEVKFLNEHYILKDDNGQSITVGVTSSVDIEILNNEIMFLLEDTSTLFITY